MPSAPEVGSNNLQIYIILATSVTRGSSSMLEQHVCHKCSVLAQNIFIDLQIVASILFVTHSTTMGCVASDQAAEPVATVALELPVAGSVEHSTGSAPRKAKAAKKKCAGKAGISSDDWVGLALVHRTL